MPFADYTSILVININQGGTTNSIKQNTDIISRFKVHFLSLKLNKPYYLDFRTKNCIDTTLDIRYFNKRVAIVTYTKFLGLVIDDANLG